MSQSNPLSARSQLRITHLTRNGTITTAGICMNMGPQLPNDVMPTFVSATSLWCLFRRVLRHSSLLDTGWLRDRRKVLSDPPRSQQRMMAQNCGSKWCGTGMGWDIFPFGQYSIGNRPVKLLTGRSDIYSLSPCRPTLTTSTGLRPATLSSRTIRLSRSITLGTWKATAFSYIMTALWSSAASPPPPALTWTGLRRLTFRHCRRYHCTRTSAT